MNRHAFPCAALGLAFALGALPAVAQPLLRAADEFATEGARVEIAGLAGTTTLLQGLPVPTRSAALALGTRTEAYAQDGWLTAHRIQMGRIGWGTEGLEGDFFSAVEGGPRWTTRPGEGPFVRGGIAGGFVGSRQLLFGWVTVPRLQLGFQRLGPHQLLEGGLHAGALVFGRFDADLGERALGPAPAFGSYLAVHVHRLRLDVEATRVEHGDGPANLVRGTLCGHVGAFALCAEGQHAALDLIAPDTGAALPVELFRAGFLVGSTSIIP
jgi:hypothetical protein